MATITTARQTATAKWHGLEPDQLIDAFRIMQTSRRLDDREVALKRQNRIFFQISGAGHEAVEVAAGMCLRVGHDWIFPYYRDRALCLTLGVTPLDMLLQAVGAADDPASGGRQMPSHWSDPRFNIVSSSSCTGTQFLHAVGCAEANRYLEPEGNAIALVASGDGATSEGEFWESLNAACLNRLPVLFLIEDNGYAISVPVEYQTAGASISALVSGFPSLFQQEVDGCDFLASYAAMKAAVEYCRQGRGPALVHAHVIRPYSHSLSDDERHYKTPAERQAEQARDPLERFPQFLLDEGVLDQNALRRIALEVDREVHDAAQQALHADPASRDSALRHLYSDKIDPTADQFSTPAQFHGEPKTMVDLLNATLHQEMRRDPRVIAFGEDVADCSREQNLAVVKGKGGVFKVTHGLQSEFGARRAFNMPLAEAAIVGRAIGMALRGLKPVAEIQFFDYIWPAMMQLRDELPLIRWRSNNAFSAPAVVRVAIGGYLTGGAIYHSQCGESTFTHIPGLRVVFPSNALDAAGLLRTAIRCDDPVLFLEHKRLYRETFGRAPYPGPDYMVPFGKAKIVQPGTDLTVITYGAVIPRALQAAQRMEREHNVHVELVDLRCLNPFDWDAISTSVQKTNRVLVAHEDTLSWGYGAEIAARIADQLFEHLDAPIKRVAATDTFVAYQPILEDAILPQADDLFRAMKELSEF